MKKTEHGWDIVLKYIKHGCDKETQSLWQEEDCIQF